MRTIAIFAGLFVASVLLAAVNSVPLKREGSEDEFELDLSELDDCQLGALARFAILYEEEEVEAGGYDQKGYSMKKRIQAFSEVAKRHQKREDSEVDWKLVLEQIDDCTLGAILRLFILSEEEGVEAGGYEKKGFSMKKRIQAVSKVAKRRFQK